MDNNEPEVIDPCSIHRDLERFEKLTLPSDSEPFTVDATQYAGSDDREALATQVRAALDNFDSEMLAWGQCINDDYERESRRGTAFIVAGVVAAAALVVWLAVVLANTVMQSNSAPAQPITATTAPPSVPLPSEVGPPVAMPDLPPIQDVNPAEHFVKALEAQSVTINNVADAQRVAENVCELSKAGATRTQIAYQMQEKYPLTGPGAYAVTDVAIATYCPVS